eukprot:Pgem_evm1s16740
MEKDHPSLSKRQVFSFHADKVLRLTWVHYIINYGTLLILYLDSYLNFFYPPKFENKEQVKKIESKNLIRTQFYAFLFSIPILLHYRTMYSVPKEYEIILESVIFLPSSFHLFLCAAIKFNVSPSTVRLLHLFDCIVSVTLLSVTSGGFFSPLFGNFPVIGCMMGMLIGTKKSV